MFGIRHVLMTATFAAWLKRGEGIMLRIVLGRKEAVANSRWDHLTTAELTQA